MADFLSKLGFNKGNEGKQGVAPSVSSQQATTPSQQPAVTAGATPVATPSPVQAQAQPSPVAPMFSSMTQQASTSQKPADLVDSFGSLIPKKASGILKKSEFWSFFDNVSKIGLVFMAIGLVVFASVVLRMTALSAEHSKYKTLSTKQETLLSQNKKVIDEYKNIVKNRNGTDDLKKVISVIQQKKDIVISTISRDAVSITVMIVGAPESVISVIQTMKDQAIDVATSNLTQKEIVDDNGNVQRVIDTGIKINIKI